MDAPDRGRRAELWLSSDRRAPRLAREYLAATCRDWGASQYLDSGPLVVSELVTNAVRHAGTRIGLRLLLVDGALTVRVDDTGAGEPRIVPVEDRIVGGQGLAIVEKLAEEWGVEHGPGRKSVWCRLADGKGNGSMHDEPGAGDRGGEAYRDPSSEHPAPVVLTIPADKTYVVLVRSAASHLGARVGLSVAEIGDFRLAVDEACTLFLVPLDGKGAPVGGNLDCRFGGEGGALHFSVEGADPLGSVARVGGFGWDLLNVLVDSVEWTSSGGRATVRLVKVPSVRGR